jgi:hypothetical protein
MSLPDTLPADPVAVVDGIGAGGHEVVDGFSIGESCRRGNLPVVAVVERAGRLVLRWVQWGDAAAMAAKVSRSSTAATIRAMLATVISGP